MISTQHRGLNTQITQTAPPNLLNNTDLSTPYQPI